MKIKRISVLLILAALLSSCDMGTNTRLDETYTVSKIYQYNIPDSSTSFITEGFSPILLPESGKMLYVYSNEMTSELKLYNFLTDESTLLDSLWPFINDFSVSANEEYITFVRENQLKRINLNTSVYETLFSTTDNLMDYPPLPYSPDGKNIISLFNKVNPEGKYNSDSIYINIYNIDRQNSIQLDTVFLRNNDMLKTGFTNDSRKFYLSREGWNPDNHRWQIELTIYNNILPPTFYSIRRIFPDNYESKYSNYGQSSLIIFENNKILFYDLISGTVSNEIELNRQFNSIRNIRGTDYLIGIEKNKIYLMRVNGEIINIFQPDLKEEIVWADYLEKNNKIIFRTEENKILQSCYNHRLNLIAPPDI